MFGHPALRLLIGLKVRATLRRQLRRLKRPSGALFALVGFLLVALWLGGLWAGEAFRQPAHVSHAGLFLGTQIGVLVLCLMTALGAFHHRGLYLPKEEIELCFAAPVSRSDLVRYRLL